MTVTNLWLDSIRTNTYFQEDNLTSDFNTFINRSSTPATKWLRYDSDVLPFWVADMDFKSPASVIESLRTRISHGVFGYEVWPQELKMVIVEWLQKRYGWTVQEEAIVFLPGVVPGFNWAIRKFLSPADGLLIQTPVYSHIVNAADVCGVQDYNNPLLHNSAGTYIIDFDHFEHQLKQNTKMFLLCNPHNPVGRVYHRDELVKIASLCLRHNVLICSDEIHGDLIFHGNRHIPIGSLDPEIAARTITLLAPSKTFNIAGLKCAYAVIPDPRLRRQFTQNMGDLLGSVNLLGYTAALAAYKSGEKWLEDLLTHLENNREILLMYINYYMPDILTARPEGTYLAWLDCEALNLSSPHRFFLNNAQVAMNDGAMFGPGGDNFVRLNFGCPKSMLIEGLNRMRTAMDNRM